MPIQIQTDRLLLREMTQADFSGAVPNAVQPRRDEGPMRARLPKRRPRPGWIAKFHATVRTGWGFGPWCCAKPAG